MPPVSRAARMARRVLEAEGVTRPAVPVDKIASKYALIVWEDLPDDISGMLVPVPKAVGPKWVIVVNATHASVRQRFTVAHELAHVLLHKYTSPHADGRVQVRFRDEDSARGSNHEEIEANQFAAELLMPENIVRSWAERINFDLADDSDDEKAMTAIESLAKRFQVSVQALSFRIANLAALDLA
jgi:hypothetical protein